MARQMQHDSCGVMGGRRCSGCGLGFAVGQRGSNPGCADDQLGNCGQEFISLHFHSIIKQKREERLPWASTASALSYGSIPEEMELWLLGRVGDEQRQYR